MVRQEIKQEIQSLKQEMNGRFDTVESRLDNVENTFKSLGEMFEHTLTLQQGSHEKLSKTIHYYSHKIAEHDQEIFLINNQQ
ncbi:hypothetical protein [Psychrobacillus sp.]|uniref:hypothetical protein n=1 Tax=Psychrobacillus sp. TaxID=1871623 RepID=UPI0028BDECA6|nr:hypothetical protein [Psychrobacillus sp.]